MSFHKNGTVEIKKWSDVIDQSRIPTTNYVGKYTLSGDKVTIEYGVKYKDGSISIFVDAWERKFDSGLEFLVLPTLTQNYLSSGQINPYGIVVRDKEMTTKEFAAIIR